MRLSMKQASRVCSFRYLFWISHSSCFSYLYSYDILILLLFIFLWCYHTSFIQKCNSENEIMGVSIKTFIGFTLVTYTVTRQSTDFCGNYFLLAGTKSLAGVVDTSLDVWILSSLPYSHWVQWNTVCSALQEISSTFKDRFLSVLPSLIYSFLW